MLYAPYRFLLDFARGPQDPRYLGLTTAHYATLALFLIGVYLIFIRKEKPEDRKWAKDSVRIAAEKKAAEARAAENEQPATKAST